MKPFTSEATNEQEGRKLIPRTFSRRQALGLLGGGLAGASLLSTGLAAPAKADVAGIKYNDIITLKCLGDKPGPRYLDGRTHNGTVGLAPHTKPPYTGTRWHLTTNSRNVQNPNAAGYFLECLGEEPAPRWLDGRTDNGDVVLSPTRSAPYTGTRWWIAVVDQA